MSLNDYGEFSFVEVTVHFFEPGDKTYWDYFNGSGELQTFDLDLEEYGQDIQEVIEARTANEKAEEEAKAKGMRGWLVDSLGHEPDFLIKKPFVAFSFRCFGQNFDPQYSSYLDEIHSMDTDHVFKGYQDQLEKIARDLQERYKVRRLRNDWDGKVVRFVTLWNYRAWQDSYHNEWDSEWELLGLVTPSKKLLEVS